MTGKSIDVFYEVFAGMVIWYFLSRTRSKTCYSRSNNVPTTAHKKKAANMTASKWVVFFFSLFTFSFRVACFSILSDCFGLCDGLSLSSHHTPCWPLIDCLRIKRCSKCNRKSPRCGAIVDKLRGKSTKTELCSVQEKLFSRKVRHVVKSFPFFRVFFPLLP